MSTAANSDAGIEQLLRTETELLPPRSLVENARLKDYAAEYNVPSTIPKLSGPVQQKSWSGSSRGPGSLTGSIQRLSGSRAVSATSRTTVLTGK